MTNQSICRPAKFGGVLLLLCVHLFSSVSVAQSRSSADALRRTIYNMPADFVAPGVRVGSFRLKPGLELGLVNNDNIFYFSRDAEQLGVEKIGDNILHVRPYLNLFSDWNRHELNLHAFMDAAKYQEYDSEDYTDWVVRLDGRIDVKSRSAFNYSAGYWRLHETRGSPDDRNGIEPTKFSTGRYTASYSHTFNRLTPVLSYNYRDRQFDNNENILGEVIDNKDRDRSRDSLSLRLKYDYSEVSSVFLSYEVNKVDYDLKFDDSGYQRSSDGYNARTGFSFTKTDLLTGSVYLEYLNQDYDDPRFNNVNGFGIGADLNWSPTKLTEINFSFENTPRETTLTGSSGYFSQRYEIRVQHDLRRNILINGRFSYTDNTYQTNDDAGSNLQGTKVTGAGLSVNYLFNRNFYLSGGYVYSKQNANESFYDYATNRWFISLGMQL